MFEEFFNKINKNNDPFLHLKIHKRVKSYPGSNNFKQIHDMPMVAWTVSGIDLHLRLVPFLTW